MTVSSAVAPASPAEVALAPGHVARPRAALLAERRLALRRQRAWALLGLAVLGASSGATVAVLGMVR